MVGIDSKSLRKIAIGLGGDKRSRRSSKDDHRQDDVERRDDRIGSGELTGDQAVTHRLGYRPGQKHRA